MALIGLKKGLAGRTWFSQLAPFLGQGDRDEAGSCGAPQARNAIGSVLDKAHLLSHALAAFSNHAAQETQDSGVILDNMRRAPAKLAPQMDSHPSPVNKVLGPTGMREEVERPRFLHVADRNAVALAALTSIEDQHHQ
jgi:hypothetical protein